MALVSIDIGAMESLVGDMTDAQSTLPSSVSTIRGRLDSHLLGTAPVDEVSFGRPVWTWIADRIRDLNRRLTLARLIAGSTPGIPGVGVVEIDESAIVDLSDAQTQALADELAALIHLGEDDYGARDIDPRVLELLQDHAHDPYFARAIAERVSPQELDRYIMAVNEFRHPVNHPSEEDIQDFDARYDALLNGLGMTFGLASQGTGDLEVPGLTDRWTTYLRDAAQFPNGAVQRLTLVMSRGAFSTEMLLGVHEVLKEHEGDDGASAWGVGFGLFVFDPDPSKSPEANLVQDPMGALFQAMGNNPEAMRQLFTTGPTTTVTTDDGDVEVNAYLWDVLRHRGADGYSMEQLAIGLRSAMSSPPVEGGAAWQPLLATDLDASIGAIEREVRIAEENKPPWYSAAGHFILDLVGMIPGLGEWADGLNAVWYGAEGNTVDAAISAAGAVPIFGWFAVGGKWVRRALNADEVAALARALENGADVGRMLPNGTVLTRGDLSDPASFSPSSFLTDAELRRFAGRPWLQNMIGGNRFDDFMAPNYRHNEIYVDFPGNASGRARLDSYVPGEEIISRKLTQLNDVSLDTAKGYIDELVTKYPVGARIPDTAANRASGLAGQTLDGDLVLQVPPQRGGTIPRELIEYAELRGIRIVDINGFDYTP